jgi:hypothetical protein
VVFARFSEVHRRLLTACDAEKSRAVSWISWSQFQRQIFTSIAPRALDYFRAVASIRLSINRCFEQHLAKSEATPAKSLNRHQSRGQAQPIGAVQAKLGPHSGAKF